MGGDKKGGDKKGDKKTQGEFGKGDGSGYAGKSDFAEAKKGDKKGDKKGKDGGKGKKSDKKGGGGKGGTIKLPLKAPPGLKDGTVCENYINPYLFTEKAPSLRSRQLAAGEQMDDAKREQFAKENAEAKSDLTEKMNQVPKLQPGTAGDKKTYVANVVPVFFKENTIFHQYSLQGIHGATDGQIVDRKKERSALRYLVANVMSNKKDVALVMASSGIIFTNGKLDGTDPQDESLTELVSIPTGQERNDLYKQVIRAKLKWVKEVPARTITQELVTILSSIWRDAFEQSNWQKIGRTYFDLGKKEEIARMGKSLVPGLYSALHVTDCGQGLALIVDCVKKCIGNSTAWQEAQARIGQTPDLRRPEVQRQLNTMFVDSVMMTSYENAQHKKRTVHIDEVVFTESETTPQPDLPDNMSLKQYFEKLYGGTVQVPGGQPVLLSRNRKRRDPKTGEPVVEKYLPSVLIATGCPTRDPKTKPLREQMLRMCAVAPSKRYEKIKELLMSIVGKDTPWQRLSEKWGIDLQKGFLEIEGRSMPKPTLGMSKNFTKDTSGGAWNFDIDKRAANPNPFTAFKKLPHKVANVLVLCPQASIGVMKGAGPTLERSLSYLSDGKVNMKMNPIPSFDAGACKEIATQFAAAAPHVDAFVVIANQVSDEAYKAVKIESICQQGKPSQVIREQTIGDQKKLKAVCNKIATQILVKNGNSAWEIQGLGFEDVMVIGVSFHHAGSAEGRRSVGSVAGIVCSMNAEMSHWHPAEVQLKPGSTVAEGLAPEFRKCLAKYKENNGKAPKHFVFFREGGSEGEVPAIVLEEVQAIKAAISEATGSAAVIAYFLVIRQSHLRLAAKEDGADGGVCLSNPEFGAMVDQHIVHLKGYEFFLVGQKVDQGSATAVKYKCLINDLPASWTGEQFQRLAFGLCNMYYNWNGPIAVPAPCLYANRHARMFGDQLTDTGGQLLQINPASKIYKNDGLPCL